MSIIQNWRELDNANVFPRIKIVSDAIQRAFGALNVAYEALFDATAPDGSSQVWAGHDHGDEGGPPLPRNCQYTADDYTRAVWEDGYDATSLSLGAVRALPYLGKFYVSPKLARSDLSASQEVALCIKVTGGAVEVRIGVGSWYRIEAGSSPDWVFIERPITTDTTWETADIQFRPAEGTGWTIDLYAFTIVETYKSQPPLGLRPMRSGTSNTHTVYSYFDTLADDFAAAAEWLDAVIMKRLYSAINALVEGITDERAPGASSQTYAGHDHLSSGYGGRDVPMGKVFSAYRGATSYTQAGGYTGGYKWLLVEATTSNTWYYADEGLTTRRTNGTANTPGSLTADPIWKAWITDGFTSSGDPPSGAPYLDGWVFVSSDSATANVELRLYNITTDDYSETITCTLDSWNYIRYIPMSGGSWNDFAIEVRCTNEEGKIIETNGIVMGESYKYNSNNICYNSSSGGRLLGGRYAGTKVVPASK